MKHDTSWHDMVDAEIAQEAICNCLDVLIQTSPNYLELKRLEDMADRVSELLMRKRLMQAVTPDQAVLQ